MTKMVPPKVSIIIPHLNQLAALERCLASLRAQTYPADQIEIIIADNGSVADFRELLQTHPDLRLVCEHSPGPGPARNAGVAAATADILAFIDADCRAHPGWVSAAVGALEHPSSTGVVGGDVQIDLADHTCMTGLEAYESVFAYRQRLYIEKLGFSGTGNLAMRRAIFQKIGPFAGIGVAEDRDWGRRAARQGIVTRYIPQMIVYHPARTDMADMVAKWRRQTAHDLADHRAAGRSTLVWLARAAALVASTPIHGLKIIGSPRLPNWPARLRGLSTLAQIRTLRAREMLVQCARPTHHGARHWNRSM